MKRLLSFFGAVGLIATASANVIACGGYVVELPINPATVEELISVLEEKKSTFTEATALLKELLKEGINPSSIVEMANEDNKSNSSFQKFHIKALEINAYKDKTFQYINTLDEEGVSTFLTTNAVLLETYAITEETEIIPNDEIEAGADSVIANIFNVKSYSSSTKESVVKIFEWVKTNNFTS
ncbi:putative lipoprotein [Spiroplasma clarkii]|uniref:Lipoprotein n=1 Tax=Spiroplasma clarkii TaxID=2139 RepID=A0A1Y0L0M5_9MOLU|nr:lipoprotein [Spiroplasma clarkii]ARU91320.1 putative lipoprotein [Spiroplasma clarkii]ATX70744.1 hypothetical protein SCLAR_v1c04200 [Spiroplasma clarkii]